MPVFCDVSAEEQVNRMMKKIQKKLNFRLIFFLTCQIEALRDYFKHKNAKLANNLNPNDIQENMNDLIKNLDSLYSSDINENGLFLSY